MSIAHTITAVVLTTRSTCVTCTGFIERRRRSECVVASIDLVLTPSFFSGSVPYPLRGADLLDVPASESLHSFGTGGDGEPTADSIFSGITTFAHLPFGACFSPLTHLIPETEEVMPGNTFDIAFLGTPFDTGTSYRPGARFGPNGIRQGSRRLPLYGGYNVPLDVNPFQDWARVIDCGDVPVTVSISNS